MMSVVMLANEERTKRHSHADFLIRKVEAIEEAQSRQKSEAKKELAVSETVPKLLAISFEESEAEITTDLDAGENDFVVDCSTGTAPNALPSSTSLADDLSSSDEGMETASRRFRDTVEQLTKSARQIQLNADVKAVQLEIEVAYLRQQLSQEQAVNSRLRVKNHSLQTQLNKVACHLDQTRAVCVTDEKCYRRLSELQSRESTVEKHLNGLIVSRDEAVKEATYLKKMLLSTCLDCRQRLRRHRVVESSQQAPAVSTTMSRRPTYQSSTRQVLAHLPRQPPAPPSQVPNVEKTKPDTEKAKKDKKRLGET